MKNCKIFYDAKTGSRLKKIIQPPSNQLPSGKLLLCLWSKNFVNEKISDWTFAFKVLQECISWTSRNIAVQMFFLKSDRNMFARKFLKSQRFFAASFCWLWDFLLENLKSKRNSAVHCNVWMSIKKMKKLYARNNLFRKRIPNMRFWNIYILVQISFFLGTASRRFSQYFVLIFCRQSTIVAGGWHFYSAPPPLWPPTIKKLPTTLITVSKHLIKELKIGKTDFMLYWHCK